MKLTAEEQARHQSEHFTSPSRMQVMDDLVNRIFIASLHKM